MKDNLILITGGAGFIGSNLANNLLQEGCTVRILDNLSRQGAEKNLKWLKSNYSQNLEFINCDIRDPKSVEMALEGVIKVYHFAAQVAVTTSVTDPRTDFEINALGTLNVLEAARKSPQKPIVLLTSTNKVYGELDDLVVTEKETRYELTDFPNGINENRCLDFHSPYGCSKGTADQYVRDYARIYDLQTIVFRMSCIYGTRRFGNEDQGWVAHFLLSAVYGKTLSIYGNGKQVRDILWIEDLVRAFKLATANIEKTTGQVFNIGGGISNTLSIWVEFKEILKQVTGKELKVNYGDWRPGDQPIYVSDTTKFEKATGWKPVVPKEQGIEKLHLWIKENPQLFIG